MFKVLVFDWDGTLFNSDDPTLECILDTCSALKWGLPERAAIQYEIQHLSGLDIAQIVQQLFPNTNAENLTRFTTLFDHLYADYTKNRGLFPGIPALLKTLKTHHFQLAIATGKPYRSLESALKHCGIEHLFDCTRCADQTRSKPDPMMLEQIAAQLSVTPTQMVMIGDTAFDMEMAHQAGCAAIGVSYGAHSVELLSHYPHRIIVPDVTSLARYLLTPNLV